MTLATDYLGLDALLSAGELAWRDTVRAFVRDRIRPNITAWYESAVFPVEIVPEMGRLGLLGAHLSGYGCPRPAPAGHARAAARWRPAGPRWSWRRAIPGCVPSSACRVRWP